MTTNEYFDQELRVMTPDTALTPRAFALCWDSPDQDERRRRQTRLRQLVTNPPDGDPPGYGLGQDRFKAPWDACHEAYLAQPVLFFERALETGSWFSSAALMAERLPELQYVVEDFLPQGLVLLASPPKYGKSWLAMQLCLAVSEGQPFLGMPTRQATCLYLALEDGKQRLQKRLGRLDARRRGSRSLYFETQPHTLGDGLLVYLESFMARHPDCRLVVVDTLQKVRGGEAASPAASVYAADYADMGALKTFADRFGLCLVVVHHLRKSSDDTDPFNRIAGSNGIFGAADAALVLTRAKREDSQTTLDLTGRDVEDKRLVLRFDKARCQWRSLGTPAEVERAQLAEGYADDPLVLTIRAQLAEGGGKWQTNAKGFLAACEALCGFCPVESGQALAKGLDKLLPLLEEKDGIAARIESRGTAGRTYHFARQQTSPARNE